MNRSFLLPALTFLTAIFFVLKLVQLQLVDNYYSSLSKNNALIERAVYPERGFIYDRNGELLVANKPSYDLMVIPENLSHFDTLELLSLIDLSRKKLEDVLKKANRYSKKLPSTVASQLSQETHAVLQEKIWKYDGFYLQKKSIRDYRKPIASNVLGYVSEVNSNDLKKDPYYSRGELIGRQGIEKYYEKYLRGIKGKEFLQKDKFNRVIGTYEGGRYDSPPIQALDISLTLDIGLQEYGEALLQNKRGGIVAIEPSSGEILALVSAPNYDPDILVGRERSVNYRKLALDTLAKPLFDRSLQAQYAPGSPFKVLNALIALQENVITPKTQFTCDKGHFYARGAFMECHCPLRTKNDLTKAIYKSCNSYFAKTYKGIINTSDQPDESIERWKKHLLSFGLGNYLGYDLPTGKPGYIPGAAYYNKVYGENGWKAPTVISNAIGQGEVLTTPIQMANFASAIANRGFYIQPHFMKSISGEVQLNFHEKRKTTIDSAHFETIIDGMHKVVEYGTARIARIKGIEVCGKTGTVENFISLNGEKTQLTDHSMFIAFAPKENPKIALAVFIENGYWGARWAAPIASLMIEKYLNKEIKRNWLENRMLNGSLLAEYKKPHTGKPFKINQ